MSPVFLHSVHRMFLVLSMAAEKKNSPNVESRLRAARAVRFLGRVA